MGALSEDDLSAALSDLPQWSVQDGLLTKSFSFDSYGAAVHFTTAVARLAEQHDHHPDLTLTYGKVLVQTVSHDIKALSDRDLKLANAIEALPRGDPLESKFSHDLDGLVAISALDGFEQLKWRDMPGGIKFAKVVRAGETGLVAYRIPGDADPDAFVPHTHLGGEVYLVLRGTITDEKGEHGPGSIVWMPPFSRHTPKARGDTDILVLWPGAIKG